MRIRGSCLVVATAISLFATAWTTLPAKAQRKAAARSEPTDSTELRRLLIALEDTVPMERIVAINGIANLKGVGNRGASAVMRKALHDPDSDVRQAACWALRDLPDAATTMLDTLAAAITDPDTLVRANAAVALGHAASLSDRAMPLLLRAAGDRSRAVRAGAGDGLDAVLKIWPGQVPALIDFFAQCDALLRFHAGNALIPAGVAAVPPLLPLVASPDWNVRANAARALGLIGETDGAVADSLTARLRDPDFRVRQYALQALERLGTPSAHAAVVRQNKGVETHGPTQKRLTLGGHIVKPPDTSIVVVGATYREFREPLHQVRYGPRVEDVTIVDEKRIYLCDVESRTVRLLARIAIPPDLRSDFSLVMLGWQGDSIALRFTGRPADHRGGFDYSGDSRFAMLGPTGTYQTVPAPPKHMDQSIGYRDTPSGVRHFLRVGGDGDEIDKYVDDGPKIVVFRVNAETGELLPAGP